MTRFAADVAADFRARRTEERRVPRDLGRRAASGGSAREIVFSLPGDVTTTASGRWRHPDGGGTMATVIAQLVSSGSSSTTVDVLRNNSTVVASLTLVSGSTFTSTSAGAVVGVSDYLTASVTNAGTGAADLTVQVWFE